MSYSFAVLAKDSVLKMLILFTFNIFYVRRARIRKAAEEEFPGNKIPTFRSNPDAKKRLEELVKRLTETCTIRELGFEEGIPSKLINKITIITART